LTGEQRHAYSPERLDEAVGQVTELAEREGIRVALCGGLALQSYGSPRLTKDVDMVADRVLQALPEQRPLSFGGSQVSAPNGVPVDLIVRDDDFRQLYEHALDEAINRPSVPCLVVRAEYLAAMKLAVRRPWDVGDLHWLITAKGILDRDLARRIVRKYVGGQFAVQEFDREVEEAEFEAERERRARNG
jgi:hypothetical protein